MRKFINISILILILALASCKGTEKVFKSDYNPGLYRPRLSIVVPELKIYHNTAYTTKIFVAIQSQRLLKNAGGKNVEITISSLLYDIDNGLNLSDTASRKLLVVDNGQVKDYIDLELDTREGDRYLLKLTVKEDLREKETVLYQLIDRLNTDNEQYFLIKNKKSNNIIFNNNIPGKLSFSVEHHEYNIDELFVHFCNTESHRAIQPDYPDTLSSEIELAFKKRIENDEGFEYDFSDRGTYHLSINDDIGKGFVLTNYGQYFPGIVSPKELFDPLSYLQNVDSMYSGSSDKMQKLFVDNFWLARAENQEKSREILKIYYNRVIFANYYFTSYKEGWKTDRGMIYTIYGPPDELVKSAEGERWTYAPASIGPGMEFSFKYVEHPQTLNHYLLQREKLKGTNWEQMISTWNKGQVYYYQKIEDEER